MSVGDRKHPNPGLVYQRQHAPGATAVGTALARGLQNAYSFAQFGGRAASAVVQPVRYRTDERHTEYLDVQDVTLHSAEIYIPEHWDGIVAHVTFGAPSPAAVPRFRLRINATDGNLTTPSTEPLYELPDLIRGARWDLYSHTWTMDLPSLALPDTFVVEVQADDNASNPNPSSAKNRFTPYGIELWGRVDG